MKGDRLFCRLLLGLSGIILVPQPGLTQTLPSTIVPDDTLGVERSNVVQDFNGAPIEVIEGGAQRGQNLFHSFREFNISEGRRAYFSIPNDAVQNILTRVTGTNRSEILGTLGTFQQLASGQFLPANASLFLINPNGILFGTNASLDLGGSFVATTANAIRFSGEDIFSASDPALPTQVLTVSPSAFLYNAISAQNAGIINRTRLESSTNLVGTTTGLQVQNGRSLLLVGGNVLLDRGYALAFGGGRVEIGGLSGPGTIGLESRGNDLRLNFPESISRGGLTVQSGTVSSFGGGEIAIYARNVMLIEKSLLSTGLRAGEGSNEKSAGDIKISATDRLVIDNSFISSNSLSGALAGSGNITIQAKSMQLANQGGIVLSGEQAQGHVVVNVNGEVLIDNSFVVTGNSPGIGNNGDITINAQTIDIINQGVIGSASIRQGSAGKITLQAQDAINLRSGGAISSGSNARRVGKENTEPSSAIQIRAKSLILNDPETTIAADSFDAARAGDIQIVTDGSIMLDNAASISTATNGIGNGGNVQLQTRSLVMSNGSLLIASTAQQGNGGDVQINATDSIIIRGFRDSFTSINGIPLFTPSGIMANTFSSGNAGNVSIDTRQLTLRDGGYISTTTGVDKTLQDRNSPEFQGFGQGGQVTIRAVESVDVIGSVGFQRSNIGTDTNGNGNAGNLTIITERFNLRDGGAVRSDAGADSSGNGGKLTLIATASAEIIGAASTPQGNLLTRLSSGTAGIGMAGDLVINTPWLSVYNGAQIEAGNRPASKGQGGNLTINAPRGVEVVGTFAGDRSTISSFTSNDTDAQRLKIQTGRLSLRESGIVSTRTFGGGRGGDLEVTANRVEVIGDQQNGTSVLDASTEAAGAAGDLIINTQRLRVGDGGAISAAAGLGSNGRGGNLIVTATDSVDIFGGNYEDGSRLLVSSNGTKQAGDLTVTSPRLTLTNGGKILAESSTVNGGSIDLVIGGLLLLRNGSKISATAGTANSQALGDGGNVNINSQFIIAIPKEDSDITANATKGRGGNVNISSQGIFGLKLQPKLTPLSDITASSEVGLNGTINIVTPDNSAIQNNLNQLPNNNIDTNKLLAQTCLIRKDQPTGTFYITGTGSLPNRPNDLALSDYPTNTVQAPPQTAAKPWKLGDPIVEPQGFYKLADGRFVMSRECDK